MSGKKSSKADKKRKSVQNAAYKSGNRKQINKDKRAKREAKRQEWKVEHPPIVKRGSARFLRRHGSLVGFSVPMGTNLS